jgi:hypothetical protein
MQLSKVTIEVLQNLASINQGLVFAPGKVLRSMNVMKNTFVVATIQENFPRDFAIYDLNEWLAALSLVNDCDVEFDDQKMTLKSGNQTTYYYYSSPTVVVSPGDKNIVLPSVDKSFVMERDVFDKVMRNSSALKLKDLEITCKGLRVFNQNNVGNQHNIELDMECAGDDQPAILKVENLKLIQTDYDVTISNKGIAHFKSRGDKYQIEYFIALEGER